MKGICSMYKKTLLILFILIMIFGTVHLTYAQVKEINVGTIHMKINQKFDWVCWTEGEWSLTYPGGWYHREQLVGTEYKGAQDSLEYYTNGGTGFFPPDAGIWTTEYTGYGFTVEEMNEYRKYEPPQVIVDGVPARPFVGEVDPDLPCNQMLYWVNQTTEYVWCGAQHKIKAYAFTNPAFDDFIIFDYTVINNLDWDITHDGQDGPDQTIRIWFTKDLTPEPSRRSYGGDGLYPYSYAHGTAYGYDTWNDYIIREAEAVQLTPYDPPRDSLLIQYGVDANAPDDWDPANLVALGKNDDFGDPFPIDDDPDAGKLLAPCYTGFCTFLLDREYNGIDDPTQPFFSGSDDIVTELWAGPVWPHGEASGWDFYTDPNDPLRYNPADPTEPLYAGENPWTIDPGVDHSDVLGRTMLQIHGPVDIPAGDSIHWVWAIGVGSIRADSAVTLGKAWFNDQVTDLERNLIVAQGYDSLFHNLDKAYAAWISYLNTGDFNIPEAPPSPDLEVTSGPGYITLEWDYPDPGMMPANFDEWRVYRKEGHYLVDHRDDVVYKDYELITTITNENTTYFEDNTVTRGQEYHYFVTCVADGIEGSKYDNRTLYGATSFEEGIASMDSVRIVPNPYRADAKGLLFSNPDKIGFFGLPPYCTLKIYNEFGDLIKVIEHTSGSGDESWNQITESNQYVAPGVYILSIENARDLGNNSLGSKTYKFIIIR
jgi:hypothetical protein